MGDLVVQRSQLHLSMGNLINWRGVTSSKHMEVIGSYVVDVFVQMSSTNESRS